jgi:hypothetical protein
MILDKWYLDTVFPDGRVWFGYRAQLRFGKLPFIRWVSGCEVLPDGREWKASRFRALAPPVLNDGQWEWRGPDGFHGCWRPTGTGAEFDLGSDDRFRVHWNCLVPRAVVTANGVGDGSHVGKSTVCEGIGYLECLQIESTMRGLPFRQLCWGRAHAGESSLVWIRWGRGRDLTLVLEDGIQVSGKIEALCAGGVRVQTARGEWETGVGRPLCDRDVRRSFPRWLIRLAGGMAPARELKMAGPVRLRTVTGIVAGTGIWEEVTWT